MRGLFLLVTFNYEDTILYSFDLLFPVETPDGGNERQVKTAEAAIRLEQRAIRFHRIDGAKDIFRPYGKNNTLCILLAGADDTDDLPVVIQHWRTTVTRIGGNSYLTGQGVAPEARFCTHISFIINDLVAGVTEGK